MILIVTGSRTIAPDTARRALHDHIAAAGWCPTIIVHGDARGADQGAALLGADLGARVIALPVTPADWKRDRLAGHARNGAMLRRALATAARDRLDLRLVAMWDGRSGGTANCVTQAVALGIRTVVINNQAKENP